MLAPHFGPAPIGLLPLGGARPFLPAPPPLCPHPAPGEFFTPPSSFPGPPFPPPPLIPPCSPRGLNLMLPPPGFPPHKQPCMSGGPWSWNFHQQVGPPQFQTGTPSWPPQQPQWKNLRNKQKPAKVTGARNQSAPGPKPVLFVCTPCHKEYKSRETYDTHLATHVKCSHCEFECSKGAMHDHQLVHFLPAELSFSSQEDIEKWRVERRKKYPTAENVAKKQQLQDQRESRGEVADTPLYRYVSRVCGSEGGSSRQRGGKTSRWVMGSDRRPFQRGHRGGRGRGGAGGVAGGAGQEGRQPQARPERSGRGGRGQRRGRNTRRGKESGGSSCGLQSVCARKPTLLEKLLSAEIRREQNAILQCIRHIVKSEFFETTKVTAATGVDEAREMEREAGAGGREESSSERDTAMEMVTEERVQELVEMTE